MRKPSACRKEFWGPGSRVFQLRSLPAPPSAPLIGSAPKRAPGRDLSLRSAPASWLGLRVPHASSRAPLWFLCITPPQGWLFGWHSCLPPSRLGIRCPVGPLPGDHRGVGGAWPVVLFAPCFRVSAFWLQGKFVPGTLLQFRSVSWELEKPSRF